MMKDIIEIHSCSGVHHNSMRCPVEFMRYIKSHFESITDRAAPTRLKTTVSQWRKLASDLDYTGSVLWKVNKGFSIKRCATIDRLPETEDLENSYVKLLNGQIDDDCYVFFIPKLIKNSERKDSSEQKELMAEVRAHYKLPEHHLTNFGSALLLVGLLIMDERATRHGMYQFLHARTDSVEFIDCENGKSEITVRRTMLLEPYSRRVFRFGRFESKEREHDLGVFPLGIEGRRRRFF